VAVSLHQLLKTMTEMSGTDLHVTTNSPPQIRVDGKLRPLDLPPLVGVREDGQDRLVEAAGQELHLPGRHGLAEEIECLAPLGAQPGEQAARAMHAEADLGAAADELEKRPVGALGRLRQHRVEVADRLVIVDAETERQAV